MPIPDFFGILDATKRLTPPAGLEAAHADGFSWARTGQSYGDSTRLTADDWNRVIANLRMMLIATPGFDPSGRDPNDPALLRDVITGFALAKIVELLPATVLDQADELAAALAAVTSFVNTIVAAVPTNLNASNLTTGTVPVARLPINTYPLVNSTVDAAIDLNAIVAAGFHSTLVGATNANIPATGYFFIQNLIRTNSITQVAIPWASATYGWHIRHYNGTTWTAWTRISDKTYNDTLYLAKAGGALTGALTGTSGAFSGVLSAVPTVTVKASNATSDSAMIVADNAGTEKGRINYGYAANEFSAYAAGWAASRLVQAISDGKWRIGSNDVHHSGIASKGAPDVILEDQKASGTAGGAATAATWHVRTLNTKVRDPQTLMTLASNQFTPVSDGWVEWSAPALGVNNSVTRLWNVTDGVEAGRGASAWASSTTVGAMVVSCGGAQVIAGKAYRLDHYATTARAGDGLGIQNGQGTEIYSRVLFWRR